MIFSEVREYQYGDDIRDIDWNVTARQNKPFVKVYEEDRELTLMLLIDVSASENFGAVGIEKKEMVAEIAATLAFSSIQNNDKVGVIFFTDQVEMFIPPKKGRKHILHIIKEIIDFHPEHKGTDINQVLEFLTNVQKKRCTAFVISDFIAPVDYKDSLMLANRKHDVAAIQVYDKRDAELPPVGLVRMMDSESGLLRWVDTSSKSVRSDYAKAWYRHSQELSSTTARCGVDLASISTDEDFVKHLLALSASAVKGLVLGQIIAKQPVSASPSDTPD